VDRGADYCWNKAAEFKRRAEEATDECIRVFLSFMSENWTIAAADFENARENGSERPDEPVKARVQSIPMATNGSGLRNEPRLER
jgi:hypothetical protein